MINQVPIYIYTQDSLPKDTCNQTILCLASASVRRGQSGAFNKECEPYENEKSLLLARFKEWGLLLLQIGEYFHLKTVASICSNDNSCLALNLSYLSSYFSTTSISFRMTLVSLGGLGVIFSTGGLPRRFFTNFLLFSSYSSSSRWTLRRLRPFFFVLTSSMTSSRFPSSIA